MCKIERIKIGWVRFRILTSTNYIVLRTKPSRKKRTSLGASLGASLGGKSWGKSVKKTFKKKKGKSGGKSRDKTFKKKKASLGGQIFKKTFNENLAVKYLTKKKQTCKKRFEIF